MIGRLLKLKSLFPVLTLVFACTANLAIAESRIAEADWGYSLHLGGAFGTVSQPVEETDDLGSKTTNDKTINIGGFPLMLMGNTDYTQGFGIAVGASLLFDLPNSQISQQAFRASLLWHMLGGAKNLIQGESGGSYYMVSRTPSQLSFVLQGAYLRYNAAAEDLSVKVVGSTFETRIGLRYRFSFDLLNAGGVELLTSIFSIPADEERAESQTIEITMFWQL